MFRKRAISYFALVLIFAMAGVAQATVIEFTPASSNPNNLDSPHPDAYGSDANVSVSYSGFAFVHPTGYGTLDSGTGAGAYSDVEMLPSGESSLTIYFTANPGYTVTLQSFDLATYQGLPVAVDISVMGGSSAYSLSNAMPSATTFTTYSPYVTGTALALVLTDYSLYDVGINTIVYSETAATPEPSAAALALLGSLIFTIRLLPSHFFRRAVSWCHVGMR